MPILSVQCTPACCLASLVVLTVPYKLLLFEELGIKGCLKCLTTIEPITCSNTNQWGGCITINHCQNAEGAVLHLEHCLCVAHADLVAVAARMGVSMSVLISDVS